MALSLNPDHSLFSLVDKAWWWDEDNNNLVSMVGGVADLGNITTNPVFMTAADMAGANTVAMQYTPNRLYNFNTIFDNTAGADRWEAWIYSGGQVSFRGPTSTHSDSANIQAGDVNTLAFSWNPSGGANSWAYKVGLNTAFAATITQSGTVIPASGLGLAGIHGNNTQGEGTYHKLVTFHDDLTNAQLATLDAEWDDLFMPATGVGALQSQVATLAGRATNLNTAGILESQPSTLNGTAERVVTATGALRSTVATIAGVAAAVRVGAGVMQSQVATLAGTAEITRKATGQLSSQNATMAGQSGKPIRDFITGGGLMLVAHDSQYYLGELV